MLESSARTVKTTAANRRRQRYAPPPGLSRLARLAHRMSFAMLRLGWRIRGTGLEHLPRDGACLVAGNHASYLDPPVIYGLASPFRRVHFMAWDQLWRAPGVRWFLDTFDAFPVNLKKADRDSYRKANDLLAAGMAVGIFPEGTRSHDSGFHPIRRGVARLAIAHQVPIVPVVLTGADRAWPRRALVPRPGRVALEVLEPIVPPPREASAGARVAQERELLACLHERINRRLVALGQIASVPPLAPELTDAVPAEVDA